MVYGLWLDPIRPLSICHGSYHYPLLLKDIMDGISGLKDLPFLKTNLFPLTDSLLSSSDIFKLSLKTHFEYAQMLSFSGGMFIIGGTLFGWPLMIISNF